MARTPARLFGPAALTNSAADLYTSPALTITIVRHVHLSNPSGSPVTVTISVGADAAGTRLFDGKVIAAGATFDHYGSWVLAAGEKLQGFAGTTAVLVCSIFGDKVT